MNEYVTETKNKFSNPGEPTLAVSFAATRGKELQQHSWDHAMGRQKSTTQWMPAGKEEMARKAVEKFQPTHPKLLRASSVYLGKDGVDWPSPKGGMPRSLSMP